LPLRASPVYDVGSGDSRRPPQANHARTEPELHLVLGRETKRCFPSSPPRRGRFETPADLALHSGAPLGGWPARPGSRGRWRISQDPFGKAPIHNARPAGSTEMKVTGRPASDPIPPSVLLGMTALTGIVDAISFLALGHVFTANMTGQCSVSRFCRFRSGRRFDYALRRRLGRLSSWSRSGRADCVPDDLASRASMGRPRLRMRRRISAGRGGRGTRTPQFVWRGLYSAVCGDRAHGNRDGTSKCDGAPARDSRLDYYRSDVDDHRTGCGFFAGRWSERQVAPPAGLHTLHVCGSCCRRLHAETLGRSALTCMRPATAAAALIVGAMPRFPASRSSEAVPDRG
jgi:hypothetical protein